MLLHGENTGSQQQARGELITMLETLTQPLKGARAAGGAFVPSAHRFLAEETRVKRMLFNSNFSVYPSSMTRSCTKHYLADGEERERHPNQLDAKHFTHGGHLGGSTS